MQSQSDERLCFISPRQQGFRFVVVLHSIADGELDKRVMQVVRRLSDRSKVILDHKLQTQWYHLSFGVAGVTLHTSH